MLVLINGLTNQLFANLFRTNTVPRAIGLATKWLLILSVENCGFWWPKYCYGDIKFTLGITINVDIYLFYKRFLEYSSIHIARVLVLSSILDLSWTVNRPNCLHSSVSQSPRTHISPHTDIHIQTSPLRIRPSPAQKLYISQYCH